MTYLNKFNQIMGNVVGSKPFNKPLSYAEREYHGIGQQQHGNFPYESPFGGGIHTGGMGNSALPPYMIPGYMYPNQQYNLKVSGTGHEQATGYDHAHYSGNGNSGYGVPRFQGTKNKIKGTALSALTLLAFLYFLNLLQTCLRDQMNTMNPTVLVMTAGSREGVSKLDRLGTIEEDVQVKMDEKIIPTITSTIKNSKKQEIQWDLLKPQTSIKPNIQNLFLETESWG